jgi:hypothetical protein
MTESKDNTENYDEMDPRAVDSLIESDEAALAELNELTESAELLAVSVPQVEPPAHLKSRILRMADEDLNKFSPAPAQLAPWWQRAFQSGVIVSAAAAVLVVVAGSALGYQNNQLSNELDTLRSDLNAESVAVANLQSELSTTMSDSETRVASMKSEMELMENEFGATNEMVVHQEEMVSELATANDALRQALRDQSWLTYVAMKEGYQVESWLASNTQQVAAEPDPSGLIAVRVVGNEAVFQVHGLAQPQPGFAYTLWLMGYGDPRPVTQFEVSEIGSATIAFLLPASLHLYSSVMVTQERLNGVGNDPSGTMVLSAETN